VTNWTTAKGRQNSAPVKREQKPQTILLFSTEGEDVDTAEGSRAQDCFDDVKRC